nr:restriction endonuclease subunit S [Hymenobacter psoromatis]
MTGPFGTSLGREDFIKDGIPVLTIGCLTEQGINLNKAVHISEQKATDLERYRLSVGDLLFSRMASVGRAGFVSASFEGAFFNYHIMRLRLANHIIKPHYFLYYVRGSGEVVNYLKRVNHGATRDGINTEQLLNMPVCLPPFAEQAEIIAEVERRLTVLDALSQTLTAELKRAERLRQSLLHRAFTGRLVPQDSTDEPAAALLARLRAAPAAGPAKAAAKGPRGRKAPAQQTTLGL